MKQIKHDEWFPVYDSIPKLQKKAFVTIVGYKHCHNFTNRFFISESEFEALQRYVDTEDIVSKNTIKEYLPFEENREQVALHYEKLKILMNGSEMQKLKELHTEKLQAYHGHLFKQLN